MERFLKQGVRVFIALPVLAGVWIYAQSLATPWSAYGHDPQHSGQSAAASQPYNRIKWSTPVDNVLANSTGTLYIHYGSPLVTAANSVIVPLRTNASNVFQVDVRNGSNGALKYSLTSDYQMPPHDWIPAYSPAVSARGRLYYAGAGGTVLFRDSPDAATGTTGRIAFYGNSNYTANKTALNSTVYITTPITSNRYGDIFFGYLVTGSNPLNLQSGIARISAAGAGSSITAVAAAGGDTSITQVQMGSAPALSIDQFTLYFGLNSGNWTGGYLAAVDSRNLAPIRRVRLKDPVSHSDGFVMDDSTASPTVGPDGDVFFGILENPFPNNDDRGWMLHFNSTLTVEKTPGAFGWDDTASVVPAKMVPSYTGTSAYLLFSKYNNYIGIGPQGNGQNRIAILDPGSSMTDPITGATIMREVMTILGPTVQGSGRTEWCINSAAVDPATKSIIANNEDGVLYKWNLVTNTLSQIQLTAGVGEAYTPTVIGVDGTVYAINDAILFAVGQ